MPVPNPTETQDAFISRCIKAIMPSETTDEKQAYAICKSKWEKKLSNFHIICKKLGLDNKEKK